MNTIATPDNTPNVETLFYPSEIVSRHINSTKEPRRFPALTQEGT